MLKHRSTLQFSFFNEKVIKIEDDSHIFEEMIKSTLKTREKFHTSQMESHEQEQLLAFQSHNHCAFYKLIKEL